MKKQNVLFLVALFAHVNICRSNWIGPLVGGSLSFAVVSLLYQIKNLKFEMSQKDGEMEIVLTALLLKSADSVRSSRNGDRLVAIPGSNKKIVVPGDDWRRADALSRAMTAKLYNPQDPTGVKECPQAASKLKEMLEKYQIDEQGEGNIEANLSGRKSIVN